jgi:hypothetical protein
MAFSFLGEIDVWIAAVSYEYNAVRCDACVHPIRPSCWEGGKGSLIGAERERESWWWVGGCGGGGGGGGQWLTNRPWHALVRSGDEMVGGVTKEIRADSFVCA